MASSRPIRLIQFTDLHLHADPARRVYGLDTAACFRAVLDHARASRHWPPDALLLTGDLAQDDPQAYPVLRDLLQPALAGMDIPALCLAGNHDAVGDLETELSAPPFISHGSLRRGDWRILLLNSVVAGQTGGRLGTDTLDRLRETLARETAHVLLCVHHQPVPVGNTWLDAIGLEDGAQLRQLLDDLPQTGGVVFGHVHQAHDSRQGGIRYLGTPSTFRQFLPGSDTFALDETAPPAWRWLQLEADGTITTGVESVSPPASG